MNNPVWVTLFYDSIDKLLKTLVPYRCFDVLIRYFRMLQKAALYGSLLDNLAEDPHSGDTVNYLIEVFSQWHDALQTLNHDQIITATVDFADALRHFFLITMPEAEATSHIMVNGQETEPADNMIGTRKLISAAELFTEIEIDYELMEELKELENDISELDVSDILDTKNAEALAAFFRGFARVLNTFVEFRNLADSMLLLGNKIETVDTSAESSMTMVLINAIIADMLKWKEVILVEKTAKDIHYMDDSFFGNIAQIELLLSAASEVNENDSEMVFF